MNLQSAFSSIRWAVLAALLLGLAVLTIIFSSPSPAQAQSVSLTATVNDDRSVTLTLTDGPANWWFKINAGGTCTAVSGNTVSNIRGYQSGTHAVGAYSDSGCQQHLDAVDFTIPTATLATTVNNDRSVDLTLTNGPSNWWFRIGGGTCSAASGTGLNNIRGYQSGTHSVWTYSDSGCKYHVASSSFTIPTATLATTVNNDRSVDLTLTNGPSNWWFRINTGGACTAVSGTTLSGIQGYKAGTHNVWAYSDSGCNYHVASSSFTIPDTSISAVVNDDRSVTLTLSDGPANWWFRINAGGSCTAATGTTVSNIRGYQAGIHDIFAFSGGSCQSLIAHDEFTIPMATLTATVNNGGSVTLTLTGGPGNWWFRINSWGACTAATGTTVSNIQGYQAGTHSVAAYSDSGCNYPMASSSFTIPPLPAAPASVTVYRGFFLLDVEWSAVPGATGYNVNYAETTGPAGRGQSPAMAKPTTGFPT